MMKDKKTIKKSTIKFLLTNNNYNCMNNFLVERILIKHHHFLIAININLHYFLFNY